MTNLIALLLEERNTSRMEWLQTVFGSNEQYEEALVAYSIALNIFELAVLINEGRVQLISNPGYRLVPRIPTYFHFEVPAVQYAATNLLTTDGRVLEACWTYLGVSLNDMKTYWNSWMQKVQSYWTFLNPRMGRRPLPHENILP